MQILDDNYLENNRDLATWWRELDGVIDKVDKHLQVPPVVTIQVLEENLVFLFGVKRAKQSYIAIIGKLAVCIEGLLDDLVESKVLIYDTEWAVFQLGIVQ